MAFENCVSLENISIPSSVVRINEAAFYNCSSLTRFNSSEDGEFNIPQLVNIIPSCAFYNCLEASNITISDEVSDDPPRNSHQDSSSDAPFAVEGFEKLALARDDACRTKQKQDNIWRENVDIWIIKEFRI